VTGKIPPRGVNLESDRVQAIINNIMHYITKEDYEAARKFISNPEEYDFRKILNW
jgi:6-phosphofructokinase 1